MNIRDIIKLLEAAGDNSSKIDRSAFIYLPPKGNKKEFAQCSTCQLFLPTKERCGIFGKSDKVVADASCGLYIQGTPNDDQPITGVVTPDQAGYVLGQVRCENCSWGNNGKCGLFELLNEKLSDVFKLNETIDAQGCCNAFQAK